MSSFRKTVTPLDKSAGATGVTVQSCPDSILPAIEFPRGRNCTTQPALKSAMCRVAQLTAYTLWLTAGRAWLAFRALGTDSARKPKPCGTRIVRAQSSDHVPVAWG